MKDWITPLVTIIKHKNENLTAIEPLLPNAFDGVEEMIRKDLEQFSLEIGETGDFFDVTRLPTSIFVSASIGDLAHTQLEFDRDLLAIRYEYLDGQSEEQIDVIENQVGGVSFLRDSNLLSYAELSRMMLEPIIKKAFHLD